MDISLHNIGIIDNSTISIGGLSVVTGMNNSGKTTIGRVIFSLFDAVENIDTKNLNDKRTYATGAIQSILSTRELRNLKAGDASPEEAKGGDLLDYVNSPVPYFEKLGDILDFLHGFKDALKSFDIESFYAGQSDIFIALETDRIIASFKNNLDFLLHEIDAIENVICADGDMSQYAKDWIILTLNNEFSGQIQPIRKVNPESDIEITGEDGLIFSLRLKNNSYDVTYNERNNILSRIFLLDDIQDLESAGSGMFSARSMPMSQRDLAYAERVRDSNRMEFLNSRKPKNHNEKNRIYLSRVNDVSLIDEQAIQSKYSALMDKLNEIIPGGFVIKQKALYYKEDEFELNVKNLSSGSKVLAILKVLMSLGEIDKNTMLILDEPEVHLHPEWQNKYAELLVLLVKEYGVQILLTTHSPNFLLALETYATIYKLGDKFKVYTTQKSTPDNMVNLQDVSDDIETAYEILSKPYLEMDELRYKLEEDEEE